MSVAYDVPAHVTFRDVSRPAKNETPAARMHRMASKAVIEGVQIFREAHSGRLYATSARGHNTLYALKMNGQRHCTCEGFRPDRPCKHVALALAELGELPAIY